MYSILLDQRNVAHFESWPCDQRNIFYWRKSDFRVNFWNSSLKFCQSSEYSVILCWFLANTLTLNARRKYFMRRTHTFWVCKTFYKFREIRRTLNYDRATNEAFFSRKSVTPAFFSRFERRFFIWHGVGLRFIEKMRETFFSNVCKKFSRCAIDVNQVF